jgi:site-specific DNA recombinase
MIRPQIISESLFQQVTELRRTLQITSPKNAKNKYLLRGLIKCRNCGLTYSGATWSSGSHRKTYYTCNGSSQWKKLGRVKCPSKALRADSIEEFVWEDVKNFVLDPEIVLEQLAANQQPVDDDLGEQIASVEAQIKELHRQKENTLIIAAQSQEVNVQTLDAVLAELRRSQNTLEAHKRHLEGRFTRGDTLEKELFGIAKRLAGLQNQIHNATFDDKCRAVSELVKGIQVSTETIQGKKTAIVEITYRFQEPLPPVVHTPQFDTLILNAASLRSIW